jgi:hypothetical protein
MYRLLNDAPEQTSQRVIARQGIDSRALLTTSARLISRLGRRGAGTGDAAMTGMRGHQRGGETLPDVIVGGVLPFSHLLPFTEVCQVADEELVIKWSKTIFLQRLKQS